MTNHDSMMGNTARSDFSSTNTLEEPIVTYTLQTTILNGRFQFVGKGESIDGQINPTLVARVNDVLRIILINGDGVLHDIVIPDLGLFSERVFERGDQNVITLKLVESGEFAYFCSVPDHRQAGMEGILRILPD